MTEEKTQDVLPGLAPLMRQGSTHPTAVTFLWYLACTLIPARSSALVPTREARSLGVEGSEGAGLPGGTSSLNLVPAG